MTGLLVVGQTLTSICHDKLLLICDRFDAMSKFVDYECENVDKDEAHKKANEERPQSKTCVPIVLLEECHTHSPGLLSGVRCGRSG